MQLEEVLKILVQLKLKKEVDSGSTIKELSGGKSTLQNEILADLQKEFGDALPERAEEMPIKDLADSLWLSLNSIFKPGKHSMGLIARLLNSKMPPGINQASIRTTLLREYGLEELAADQMLVFW